MKRELKKVLSIYCGNISGLVSLFLRLLLGFWRPSHVRPSVQTLARTLIIDVAGASDSAKAFVHHLRDFFPPPLSKVAKEKEEGGKKKTFLCTDIIWRFHGRERRKEGRVPSPPPPPLSPEIPLLGRHGAKTESYLKRENKLRNLNLHLEKALM